MEGDTMTRCTGKRPRQLLLDETSPVPAATHPLAESQAALEESALAIQPTSSFIEEEGDDEASACKKKRQKMGWYGGRKPDTANEITLYHALEKMHSDAELALSLPNNRELATQLPASARLRSAISNSLGLAQVYITCSKPIDSRSYPLITKNGGLDLLSGLVEEWTCDFDMELALFNLRKKYLELAEMARKLFVERYVQIVQPLYKMVCQTEAVMCAKTRAWLALYRDKMLEPEMETFKMPCLII
jgi:hypothetical protein